MRVTKLLLEDFRSYARTERTLAPAVTALIGRNGAGKTNVLEAVHLIARGDSPRARDDTELVRWGANTARVSARVERVDDARTVDVVLFSPPEGERRRPRRYLLDGAGKRADEAIGELAVVSFFPEDVQLLAEAPSARRRYLDAMVGQVHRRHRAETREYQRVLEQRNSLLRALRSDVRPGLGGPALAEPQSMEIGFWDTELVRLAASISLRRLEAVRELVAPFREAATRFSGADALSLAYAAQVEGDTVAERAAAYQALIGQKRERELWQGTTLVGPHREDLAVSAHGRALPTFASRGEQRSAVLSLKLAEAAWIRERVGELPVFLLDDVLSELDPGRRDALVDALPEHAQTLLTAAFEAGVPERLMERADVVRVRDGAIG
ncbi:MAG: replication and repair protein RecF [Chloroflexota bacterium]|jgi:DNA replication and repair protein RecF|nr:replication and repair protein RecF [Chloroflexota bacterium]